MEETSETWVWPLDQEDPLESGMAIHSSILVWRIPMDRGAWRATVHRVSKSQTWMKHLTRTVRLKMLYFCFCFFMYHLCLKYYKPITVKYHIVNCISWVPRPTLLDLKQNRNHSYVRDLLQETLGYVSRSFLQKQKLILPAARSVDSKRLSPEALPRTVLAQKAAASSKVTFSLGWKPASNDWNTKGWPLGFYWNNPEGSPSPRTLDVILPMCSAKDSVVTALEYILPARVLVTQLCLTLCNNFPGKNTGVGCHALLQGIFPTQGLNPGLPHCRQTLCHLNYPESPTFLLLPLLLKLTSLTPFKLLLPWASLN